MINRIKATGCVVSIKRRNESSGSITIAEKLNSRIIRKGEAENTVRDEYITFQFNAQYTDSMDVINKLKNGSRVEIEAESGSYIKKNPDGSTKECTNFYIHKIKLEETEFSKTFGMKGGHYNQDSIAFCVEGIMASVTAFRDRVYVRLNASEKNGRTNILNFATTRRTAELVKKIPIGNRVYVDAMIRTRDIATADKNSKRDYNVLIIEDIVNADEKQKPNNTAMPNEETKKESVEYEAEITIAHMEDKKEEPVTPTAPVAAEPENTENKE